MNPWWEIPKHLEVKNGELYIADKSSLKLADEWGTPLYVMNADRVEDNYNRLFDSVQNNLERPLKIHFAAKSNTSIALLKLLNELGSCLDTVSPGEVYAGKEAGFSRDRILYTGTSVSDEDMKEVAKDAKMNIDSLSQLKRYADLVNEYDFDPKVSIRINPGEGAGHVAECMTAGKDAKYGVPEEQALEAYKLARELGLEPVGIHQHIGSGILEPDIYIFYRGAEKILDIAGKAKDKFDIDFEFVDFEFVDFGGGIGVPYKPNDQPVNITSFGENLGKVVKSKAGEHKLGDFNVYIEPGRYITSDAGILLMKAVDVNDKYMSELGVNAGFNVMDRPSRYKTYHEIVNASKADKPAEKEYRVTGNLCESGDVFTESKHSLRKLPVIEEEDIIAILNAGAYGASMGSNYNSRPRAKEVMIENGKVKLTRIREGVADLFKTQIY